MAVTVNGGAPTGPQITDFRNTFQVAAATHSHVIGDITSLQTTLDGKQSTLVSGTSIKTINSTPLLGSGNIAVQASLVSGTNIKTVNGTSLLGSGDITISGGALSDGDKGDVTVSSSGTVWTVDNLAITNAKIATGVDAVKLADGSVSNAEFQYLNGVTSAIQTQLNSKLSASDASEITVDKTTIVDADELIVLDSADSGTAKTTTANALRTLFSNKTVGTSLGTTGTVNLDLSILTGTLQTITATGNITFTTSNRVAGRSLELRVAAGASSRTLTWPSWVAFGEALPTTLASGEVLRVAISCTGTTDASIDAASIISV